MSNIVDPTDLEKLTPEELEKVGNLINKFARRHEDGAESKPKKSHHKRNKKVDRPEPQQELMIEHGVGRKQPRKKILENESDTPTTRSAGQGRTEPRKNQNRRSRSRGSRRRTGKGETLMRTEPVRLSSENKFLTMKERNAKKSDTKIDKKLWGENTATERPETYEPIEVQCKECDLWFDVNPSMLMVDPDTKDYNFTCNNCAGRR